MGRPTLIYGTATFGMDLTGFQTTHEVEKMLQALKKVGITHLDTAARYPPLNPGRSEQLLGEAAELTHTFVIDTKIKADLSDTSGSLAKEAMEKSVNESFDRLKLQKVRTIYAHAPDKTTPPSEIAAAFNAQVQAGHCDAYGVSNFSPSLLRDLLSACEEKGYTKPSYYQGDYNIVTRGMETQLLPLLRQHNMHFIAFRPVAAGFLTGKLISGDAKGTRLGSDNPLGSRLAEGVFGSAVLREATKTFVEKVEAMGLTPLEVALRWIYCHSVLGEGDGVILGASKVSQIEQNVATLQRGALDKKALAAVEDLWETLKEDREGVL